MPALKNISNKKIATLKKDYVEDQGISFTAGQYFFDGFDTPGFVRLQNSSGYTFCVPKNMVVFP